MSNRRQHDYMGGYRQISRGGFIMITSCSAYCDQTVKAAKNEARTKGCPIPKDISVSVLSPDEYAVFIGDHYSEHNSCCEMGAVFNAIEEIIDEEC